MMKKTMVLIITMVLMTGETNMFFENTYAAEEKECGFEIVVNGERLECDHSPFYSGKVLMVPLRKISEALGYKVEWDEKTGAVTVDDEYIQKATLYDKCKDIAFEGRLKVINMSRVIEISADITIIDGCTFVPLEFFDEFFNDTLINGHSVSVSPQTAELD